MYKECEIHTKDQLNNELKVRLATLIIWRCTDPRFRTIVFCDHQVSENIKVITALVALHLLIIADNMLPSEAIQATTSNKGSTW